MNHFDPWLNSATVQALGWTLIHFIWQGALLALLLPLVLRLLRTAKARYAAGLSTLALMSVAPVITFLVLFEAPSSAVFAPVTYPSIIHSALTPALAASGQLPSSWFNVDWLRIAVVLWFAGIVALSLRTLGGWYLMERLRRRNAQLTGSLRVLCLQLQERIGIRRTVSYCQSYLTDGPSVIGWFRPVVLLPASALTGLSPSQLEAIIVHELAHIRRLDAFVNLFQIAVETILFYHPGVWWVSRRVRVERENCCDDMAVSICGNALEYAKALTLMASWRTLPALALAANGGSLKTRVSRLLGLQTFATGVPRIGVAGLALVLSAGVLLAGARFTGGLDHAHSFVAGFTGTIDPPEPPPAPDSEPAATAPPAVPSAPVLASMPAVPRPPAAPGPAIAQATPLAGTPEPPRPPAGPAAPAPASPSAPPLPPEPPAPAASGDHSSYIDGMAAAGFKDMSVDDLIAMKVQGITPEYVRDMRATGVSLSRSQLVEMKIQGVTPEYARRIRETWKDVTARDLVEMRIQGVDPGDVGQFRRLGMGDMSVRTLIEMKIQGVTPEYARRIRETWKDATARDLVEMRIQGVNPGDVGQFRQLGMGDMSVRALIEMRIQGVTPEYVRQMKDAGFGGTTREYINAKVLGVTPEFVRTVRSHGFTDLSAHKLIELKAAGVF